MRLTLHILFTTALLGLMALAAWYLWQTGTGQVEYLSYDELMRRL